MRAHHVRPAHGADTGVEYEVAARLTLGAPCRRSACGADPDVQAAVGVALRADSVLLPRL